MTVRNVHLAAREGAALRAPSAWLSFRFFMAGAGIATPHASSTRDLVSSTGAMHLPFTYSTVWPCTPPPGLYIPIALLVLASAYCTDDLAS
jgi:hypothetical protein